MTYKAKIKRLAEGFKGGYQDATQAELEALAEAFLKRDKTEYARLLQLLEQKYPLQ